MNIAIIAAGGRGERFGGAQAKQFRPLAGAPVIIHTLRQFERAATVGETIVVLPATDVANFLGLSEKYGLRKLARVVAGGPTRGESVYKGLQSVRAATAEIVAVHDGVRPFVTPEEIDRTMRAAGATGAAVLAAPIVDTIKEVADERVVRTVPREKLRRALTPQCFRYELLRRAYEQNGGAEMSRATDDSALVEMLGAEISIVEGSARNIKITRPEDFALAEVMMRGE